MTDSWVGQTKQYMSIFLFFLGVAEFAGGQGTLQAFVYHCISLLSASYPQNPMSCIMGSSEWYEHNGFGRSNLGEGVSCRG